MAVDAPTISKEKNTEDGGSEKPKKEKKAKKDKKEKKEKEEKKEKKAKKAKKMKRLIATERLVKREI